MQNTLKVCQLKINNMSALTTDGAPALLGNTGGVAAIIKRKTQG
jgi:hypothetical protein